MTPGCTALAVRFVPAKRRESSFAKEQVGELRLAVHLETTVVALAVQVVELDACFRRLLVALAAQHHHAAVLGQAIEKASHQDEVTDVVGEKLQLVAVRGLQLWQHHDAGVANDGVELPLERRHRGHARLHAGGIRQFAGDGYEGALEPFGRFLGLRFGAGCTDHTSRVPAPRAARPLSDVKVACPGRTRTRVAPDPVHQIALGYVMNRMDWRVRSPRAPALCRALYDCEPLRRAALARRRS